MSIERYSDTIFVGADKILPYYRSEKPKIGDIIYSYRLEPTNIVAKMEIKGMYPISNDMYLDYTNLPLDMSYIIRPTFMLYLVITELFEDVDNKFLVENEPFEKDVNDPDERELGAELKFKPQEFDKKEYRPRPEIIGVSRH